MPALHYSVSCSSTQRLEALQVKPQMAYSVEPDLSVLADHGTEETAGIDVLPEVEAV